jgi:hypothetical protein
MPNCCYAGEYIEGAPRKLGNYSSIRPADHIRKAVRPFREAGIHQRADPSIFFPDDPEKLKFIDLAMEEFHGIWYWTFSPATTRSNLRN